MEYTYKYIDKADRQTKVSTAEGNGYQMLQDNFDPDWKRGDEIHGTMIFTDVHRVAPPSLIETLRSEWKTATTATQKIAIIAKALNLE